MAPKVELGQTEDGGVAPAIMAIVDRGARRRPELAAALRAEVELNIEECDPPVRIEFRGQGVLVEDGPAAEPDLRITGTLPDLVSLMVAPLVAGLPNPIASRGRTALGLVALRRVRVEGRLALMRQFLAIIQI
jgi:hypothetical protein